MRGPRRSRCSKSLRGSLGSPTDSAAHLRGDHRDDGLSVDEAGLAEVVEAIVGKDLRASLEPGRLIGGAQLGGDAAEGTQHGPAGVDELGLTVSADAGLDRSGTSTRLHAQ